MKTEDVTILHVSAHYTLKPYAHALYSLNSLPAS